MDKEVLEKLQSYRGNQPHTKKCFALKNWLELQQKSFKFSEALLAIYDAAGGSFKKMDDIIDSLTAKKKVYGRTQVYGENNGSVVDLRRGEDGQLHLHGFDTLEAELPLKGQHTKRNPRVFRKSDGQVNKNYVRVQNKMLDLGEIVREMYPNESNVFITQAMKAIREYAASHKTAAEKVAARIKKGVLKLDDDSFGTFRVIPKPQNESHVIVITEDTFREITDNMKMTEHKFNSNIIYFIKHLKADPVNTELPYIFKAHGYTRGSFIRLLIDNGLLIKKERISDKDEYGEPKKATMMVRYGWPEFENRKQFDRKLKRLFIKLFEKNVPERKKPEIEYDLNEDGAAVGGATGGSAMGDGGTAIGGATSAVSSGPFVSPIGGVVRRKMPTELDETTATTNAGDYTYDVPAFGDKESLSRKSPVSVQKV